MQAKFWDARQPTLSPFILLQSGGVMRQQRWHHRYLSLPSLFFFFFPPSFFYLVTSSPRMHSSSPSVHLHHFAPHHLLFSSPVKWSLRPFWSPDQLPPPSLPSVSLYSWLPFFHSLILMLIWLPTLSHSLFLFCSCALVTFHVFFSSSDLSILPILFPSSNPAFPQFLFSPFLSCCFSVTLTFSLSPLLWPFTVSHLLNMHFHLMFSLRYLNHFISHHHWLLSNAGRGTDGL